MEIPFRVKGSNSTGVLIHPEAHKEGLDVPIMIRAASRCVEPVTPGQVLVFTEHDGALIELVVATATPTGNLELGPDNASDFALALGLE